MSYSNFVQAAQEEIRALIPDAFRKAIEAGQLPQGEIPNFVVEIPADTSHGDFATNAAMVSAKAFRSAPAKIAAALIENMELSACRFLDKASVAGPGFIN